MPQDPIRVQLPLKPEEARELRAGQALLLSGPMFTLRDAGHQRLLEEMGESTQLPYGLEGQTIFYAGPTPSAAGRPFGAIGPTTASRMDFAAPHLMDCGLAATMGKGTRSQAVKDACVRNGAVYFVAVGGAAAYLAKCIESCQTLAYDELGTEALRRIDVVDFPVFVGIDVLGNDIYSIDR
jgi:fumarate hydratase subunit beta